MDQYQLVKDKLDSLGIDFELVEHEPAVTTELADKFIEGIEGVRTKTLFLTDQKKRRFYLIIMDDGKMLDMDNFKDLVGEKRVKMASSETLDKKMGLAPGVVSPFGLLNNEEKDIKVFIDEDIINEDRMSFHPNTNEKTIFVETEDLLKYLDDIGCPAHVERL